MLRCYNRTPDKLLANFVFSHTINYTLRWQREPTNAYKCAPKLSKIKLHFKYKIRAYINLNWIYMLKLHTRLEFVVSCYLNKPVNAWMCSTHHNNPPKAVVAYNVSDERTQAQQNRNINYSRSYNVIVPCAYINANSWTPCS